MKTIKDAIEIVFLLIALFITAVLLGITNIIKFIAKLIGNGISYLRLIIKYPRNHKKSHNNGMKEKNVYKKKLTSKDYMIKCFLLLIQCKLL